MIELLGTIYSEVLKNTPKIHIRCLYKTINWKARANLYFR